MTGCRHCDAAVWNDRRRRVRVQVGLLRRRRDVQIRFVRCLFGLSGWAFDARRRNWRVGNLDLQRCQFGLQSVHLRAEDAVLVAKGLLVVTSEGFAVVFDPYALDGRQ